MSTDYILAICDSNVPLLHHPVIQSSSSGCLLMAAPINIHIHFNIITLNILTNTSVTSSSSPWSSPRPVDVYWWQHLLMLMFSQADRNPLSYSELCYIPCTELQCYIHGTLCYNVTYTVHLVKMLHTRNTFLQCFIHGARLAYIRQPRKKGR